VTVITDPSLESAIAALDVPGIKIAHRLILPGDEDALLPREAQAFASSVVGVRRASGAARIVARQLLAQLGTSEYELLKFPSGAPIWPAGIVGSMAHDARVAIAAVGRRHNIGALGIDIEPAEPLAPELLELVATPAERLNIGHDRYGGRLLFVAKEAAYKAVFPLDQTFLEHHDVEVSIPDRTATIRNGRVVDLRFYLSTHLVAVAFLSPARLTPTEKFPGA
jgi:4'-phosphopantetheinyl transferase EntD